MAAGVAPSSSPLADSPVATGFDAVGPAAGQPVLTDSAAGSVQPAVATGHSLDASVQVWAAQQLAAAPLLPPSGSNLVAAAPLAPSPAPLDNPVQQTIASAVVNRPASQSQAGRLDLVDAAAADLIFVTDRLDYLTVGAFSDLALSDAGPQVNNLAVQAVLYFLKSALPRSDAGAAS